MKLETNEGVQSLTATHLFQSFFQCASSYKVQKAQTEDVVVFSSPDFLSFKSEWVQTLSGRPQSALAGDRQVLGPVSNRRRTGVQTINIPVCSPEVRSRRLHRLKFRQLPLAAVWRHPSAEVAWCRLLTKPADY